MGVGVLIPIVNNHVFEGCNHDGVTMSSVSSLSSTRHGPMGVLPHPLPGSYRLDQAGEGTGSPGDQPVISGVPLKLIASFASRGRARTAARQPEGHGALVGSHPQTGGPHLHSTGRGAQRMRGSLRLSARQT